MESCCVSGCKSLVEASELGVTFHSFPTDPEIRKKWIDFTGQHNWQPNERSKLCSLHFDGDSYFFDGDMVNLKPNAVPDNPDQTPVPVSEPSTSRGHVEPEVLDESMEETIKDFFGYNLFLGQSDSTIMQNMTPVHSFGSPLSMSSQVKHNLPDLNDDVKKYQDKLKKKMALQRSKHLRALRESRKRLLQELAMVWMRMNPN